MKIDICLPKSTGFWIEIDENDIHSKCEDFETIILLSKGNHVIYAKDQGPTPLFWSKLFSFLNPLDQSIDDYSDEIAFSIKEDLYVVISIRYEMCDQVSFVFDDELSEFLV